MADDLTAGINAHLEKEVERLEREKKDLQVLLARPVAVTVMGPDNGVHQVVQYLPQLTFIATNVSMVASAVQASNAEATRMNKTLDRIATALEALVPEEEDKDESA